MEERTICIGVDSTSIDEMIKKTEQLKALLKEVHELIRQLKGICESL